GLPELLSRTRPAIVLVLGGINDRWNGDDRGPVAQFLARHLRTWTFVMTFLAQNRETPLDATVRRDAMPNGLLLEGDALEAEIVANLGAIARCCTDAGA